MNWSDQATGKVEPLVEIAGRVLLDPVLQACRAAGYHSLTIQRDQFCPGDVRYLFCATYPKGNPEPRGPWWRRTGEGADPNTLTPDGEAPAVWGIIARALGHLRKVAASSHQIQIECEGVPTGFYDLTRDLNRP